MKLLETSGSATAVLVAEKESIARTSLSELLRHEGYRVLEACNAQSSIDRIAANPGIRVILADLDMPGWPSIIDQAQALIPQAVILAMGGYHPALEIAEAQRVGIDQHFPKPLAFIDIRQAIERLLVDRSMARS